MHKWILKKIYHSGGVRRHKGMKDNELPEFRCLCGLRIAAVWEKDELMIWVRSDNGMSNMEVMEEL